ncbi:nucleotide-binding universal stress UspA family protein [Blastococcus colisei]|uniref:Nucleotide-binding universal stress UspA family protein n=1 Tax=Blastococcus colisei TaxID=1564162 RepID=A0A543PI83_9ACTN|nr:universal stress protein [Blastococcus colisei]TQN43767.1 nucleotide-binding universal stress UspA family protein [Blastococcus colisei]
MTEPLDPRAPVGEGEKKPGPRVVVGIDFSSGARAALLFALQDASRRGVPVEAVTAYRPPEYWMDFYAVGTYEPDQQRVAAIDRLRQFVAGVVAEGPQPPPEVQLRAAMGTAADVLIGESHGADLLVVGSRGHGGFTSMLLGSVSMQCALHASCPVTVVHSPEARHERLHLRRSRRHDGADHEGTPVG